MGDAEIREVFITEAKEILDSLENDIVKLEEVEADQLDELVNEVFRNIHTMKGSSGIAGYTEIYEFSHDLESLFDMVRQGDLSVTRSLIDIILESLDWIKAIIFGNDEDIDLEKLKDNLLMRMAEVKEASLAELKESGLSEIDRESSEEAVKEFGYRFFLVKANFNENIFENGIDPLMIMEDLVQLGKIQEKRVINKNLPEFDKIDPEKCYLGWELILKTKQPMSELEEVFLFVKDDNDIVIEDITDKFVEEERDSRYLEERRIGEILVSKGIITEDELEIIIQDQDIKNMRIGELVVDKGLATEKDVRYALGEQEKIKKKIETTTVRVDTRKLDNLMNLLGEIVIGQSGISRISDELEEEKGLRLKNALYGLDRITREFQELIMTIRMIPIGSTFEQFRRFVRDTALSHHKEIRLEIRGKETELDKTVIERIGDPLKHMIRNAIDHGIEMPDERVQLGKPKEGRVTLNAYHQEGNVYIEISDDGRGFDKESIRSKAEEKGLIKSDEEVSDGRLFSFLFLPGFSTSVSVGDLSGRGVGMDVVKTNIESLRGQVEMESVEGKGTTIRIKLPLTLAIIEGMLVRIGDNIYIIPLLSIVESIQPKEEEIKTVEGKGEVVYIRGEYVSLIRVNQMFGIKTDYINPWDALIVIVESVDSRIGIMIDELLGQQQIVIKSLDINITDSRAISGASILGDGRVALIIDVHGLIGEMIYQS